MKMDHTRKAVVSAAFSLIFMGLGQLYNRQYVKGLLLSTFEWLVILFLSKPIIHGLWGLITLGEQVQVRQRGRIVEQGDHSIFLMIEGIMLLIVLLAVAAVYAGNVVDAYRTTQGRSESKPASGIRRSLVRIWEKNYAYVLLSPAMFFALFLIVLPLLFGVLIAFTNYSAPNHLPPKNLVEWVGFDTFRTLFTFGQWSHTFLGVTVWTVTWAVLATVTTFFVGMMYALIINHPAVRLKRLWRSIFILPWAIPQFISILIFRNIFNGEFGPLNQLLTSVGLNAVPWLSDPFWAKTSLVLVNVWFGFPYWMILMSGVLTGIDKSMYEAAEIDGANARQRFSSITLPSVMQATMPLFIMSFAGNFNNFNLIYLFTAGGPVEPSYTYAGSTDILITWIYGLTLTQNQFHIASALSVIIFVFIAALSIWNFRRTRSFREEDLMQ
ncbi:carbohydrate ABC transporter permease [Paenibacillaceae bacterium WGS1546]|uniref:carbohydrate ABC transporter permease n=1 Tax=Cohnella sp. WGS1546 TaxID=3366810 RepID=UPI00372D1D18